MWSQVLRFAGHLQGMVLCLVATLEMWIDEAFFSFKVIGLVA